MTSTTHLRLTEQEIRLLSSIDVPMWVFDLERKCMVWANDAAVALWESPSAERLIERDFGDMSQATETRLRSYQTRLERGDTATEQWTFYPKGEPKTVLCTFQGIVLDDGRMAQLVQGTLATTVDVASLRGVEALRHTSVMISMCRQDGTPLMENPAALRAYGYTEGMPDGLHAFTHRFVDADEGQRALQRVLQHGAYSAEVRVHTRHGLTWHGMDAHLTHDPVDGGPAIVINEKGIGWRVDAQLKLKAAWKDLEATVAARTQALTEANAALALSERMASVGTLAAGVAHEVNNPLTFVISNLALIKDALDSGDALDLERLTTMLVDAQTGADRVASIVRDLGAITRNKTDAHATVDVHRLIDFTLNVAAHEIRPRARTIRELGETPPVHADSSKLSQVLLNLVVNAAHAIEPGHPDDNRITVATSTDADGFAVIRVSDTGNGIAPDDLPRVFQPYFTTKAPTYGTGLGLSICYRIIQEMGGTISVDTKLGSGTTFRLRLPANEHAPPLEGSPATAADPPTPKRARILIIDDEPLILLALQRMLSSHEVVTSHSGRNALHILREQRPFDVILCDLTMPDGSGIDVYNALVQLSPEMQKRLIIMSGGAVTPEAEAFLDSIPNERIAKPFSRAEIERQIERCMSTSPAEASGPL